MHMRLYALGGLLFFLLAGTSCERRHSGEKGASERYQVVRDRFFAESDPVSEEEFSRQHVLSAAAAAFPEDRPGFGPLSVTYPLDSAVFPPEIVAPEIQWTVDTSRSFRWTVAVSFSSISHHLYIGTAGVPRRPRIDSACLAPTNTFPPEGLDANRGGWTPGPKLWETIKYYSRGGWARLTVMGVSEAYEGKRDTLAGSVIFSTSTDSVGAAIFYRDVPLMPSETETGVVKPLAGDALHLISWRIHGISSDEAPVVMSDMPTCANCHSFSHDGASVGMDMDGPRGDKGAYALRDIEDSMVIRQGDVFSWNDFNPSQTTFGLFSRVSPDGRYAVSSVDEEVFVANYTDYRFLQTFYPTRGKLAVFSRKTRAITLLPGADDSSYVHCNPVWSPDGATIYFLRAPARPAYGSGAMPTHAGDPRERRICYDLYRMPFNDGRGGTPRPVPGASDNGMSNTFPKVSPDGRWIVFVKCRNGLLMRPDSRLYIIPAEGGEARELACNLPVMNSWHSWSPNGRWLVFSSKSFTPYTQMFLAHIDHDGNASRPVLVPNATADNRAVNLPEFLPMPGYTLEHIDVPAVEYKRFLDRGKEYVQEGRLDEALEAVRQSIALRDDYADAYSTLSYILDEMGKTEEAVSFYRKAIGRDPLDHFNYLNLGVIYNGRGDYREARKLFDRALELQSKNALIYYNRAVSRRALADSAGAIRDCRTALKLDSAMAPAANLIGEIYFEQGNIAGACEHFVLACSAAPRYFPAQRNAAIAFSARGKRHEAVEHYSSALRLKPDDTLSYLGRANVLSRTRFKQEALEDYSRVLRLDPANAVALNNRGLLLRKMGRFDDAARDFTAAIDLDKSYADAWLNRGNTHLARRRLDRAVSDFTSALRLDPSLSRAFENRCIAWSMQGEYEQVIKDCTARIQAGNHTDGLYLIRANCRFELGRYEQALSDYKATLRINPDKPQYYYNIALCFEKLDRPDEARAAYRRYTRMAGRNAPGMEHARKRLAELQSP